MLSGQHLAWGIQEVPAGVCAHSSHVHVLSTGLRRVHDAVDLSRVQEWIVRGIIAYRHSPARHEVLFLILHLMAASRHMQIVLMRLGRSAHELASHDGVLSIMLCWPLRGIL